MEGGYFSVIRIVNQQADRGGPLQILRRDCGDHIEIAAVGVALTQSGGAVLHQAPSRVNKEGRIEELSLTYRSPVLGAISLPPLILKFPKGTSSTQLRDQVRNEAKERFRVSIREAFAKHRKPDSNCNEVDKVEAELVNLMLNMNLGA